MSTLQTTPAWANLPPTGPLIRPTAAADYLGLSLSSFYAEVKSGNLPAPVKIAARASGVPKNYLDAVIADRISKATGGSRG